MGAQRAVSSQVSVCQPSESHGQGAGYCLPHHCQKRGRILFSLFLLPGLPSWFPVPKLNCEGLFDFRFKPFSAGWQPLACSMVPYARDTPSGVDAVMSQCTCSPDEAQRNPGKTLNRLPRIPSCQDCIRATSIPKTWSSHVCL
jgi:hypothetical protein